MTAPGCRTCRCRFLTAVFPALERIREFGAGATPSEQELMFDVEGDAAA